MLKTYLIGGVIKKVETKETKKNDKEYTILEIIVEHDGKEYSLKAFGETADKIVQNNFSCLNKGTRISADLYVNSSTTDVKGTTYYNANLNIASVHIEGGDFTIPEKKEYKSKYRTEEEPSPVFKPSEDDDLPF